MTVLTRRRMLASTGAGVAGALLGARGRGAETKPINVLFLMTDQHHASLLRCYGNPLIKTPNLDRLAAEGARFANAFTVVPFCSPTRASILTGLYPSTLGMGRNIDKKDDPLRFREPRDTYQHHLAARGYHCHQLGKWHLGDPAELSCFPEGKQDVETPIQRINELRKKAGEGAFDAGPRPGEELVKNAYLTPAVAAAHREWQKGRTARGQDTGLMGRSRYKAEYHPEPVLAGYCIELLKRHRGEPFSITYSVGPPHPLWIAPAPYYDMYDPKSFALPATWNDRPARWEKFSAARMGRLYGEEGFREYMRCIYAQVTFMDELIGRILKALDDLGLADRTLVIFTTDHGNMLGQHGMMDKSHGDFYDDLVHVPLIMRLPGAIRAGSVVEPMVSHVDLAETILDYAGAVPLQGVHGRSMRPAAEGKSGGEEAVFCERGDPASKSVSRMIRTREWKLNHFPGGKWELFNLTKDPDETTDLAADPACANVIGDLKKRLKEHTERVGDPGLKTVFPAGA